MVSFSEDIRPLFREGDRTYMDFAFDLWNYDDVKAAAPDILARLEDGTMPCDEPWSDTKLRTFRDWMAHGYPE
jgi:hypothetical protein